MGNGIDSTVKQTLWDALKWLMAVGFGAGLAYGNIIFETKEHADKTFVKKESFDLTEKNQDERWDEVRRRLTNIEDAVAKKK